MKKIVIFGTGQLAEVVSYYIQHDTDRDIAAYTINRNYKSNVQNLFLEKPVIEWELIQARFPPEKYLLFCPVSYRYLNKFREGIYLHGKKMGYSFYSYIHSSSHICGAKIGENCIVLENCVIQPGAKIGDNTILWSSTHIGHHSEIGSHCFLAGNGGVAGNTKIGSNSFIGGGGMVADNINIGSNCIVGLGAKVAHNMNDRSVAIANPARISEGTAEKFASKLMR